MRALRHLAGVDLPGLAAGLHVPLLIVNGRRDIIARPRERAFRDAAPDATIEIVRRAGHLLPIQRSTELAAILGSFAERTSRRS